MLRHFFDGCQSWSLAASGSSDSAVGAVPGPVL
jgi:hypothetical protein